ncbi:Uncharacterised protein [uncultured archaeon]|nr:Uncharacterised protein [uncultured archaeon]
MSYTTRRNEWVHIDAPQSSWRSAAAHFRNRAMSRFGGVMSEEIVTMQSREAYRSPTRYSGPAYRVTTEAPYFSCFDLVADLRGYAFKNELDGFSINADYGVPKSILSKIRAILSRRPIAFTCEIPLPEDTDVITVNWWITNKPICRPPSLN